MSKNKSLMTDPETSEERTLMNQSAMEDSIALEGQCKISAYQGIKIWYLGLLLLFPLLVIVTFGIALLVVLRTHKWKAKMIYKLCQPGEATHFLIIGNDNTQEIVEVSERDPIVVFYRKVKYRLMRKQFTVVTYDYRNSKAFNDQRYLSVGLTREQYLQNLWIYGPCQHKVDIPGLFQYLFTEMTGVFFILQYLICVIYIVQRFYVFAAVMIGMSIITTIINYYMLRKSLMKIKEIAEKIHPIEVIRDGILETINSDRLVPGDILVPKEGSEGIPCDCVLVRGQLYLNQSSLTGETVPIQKTPPVEASDFKTDKVWLYEGSTVLQSRGQPLALVVHTGFITRKGRIIRKILYRTEQKPEFFLKGLFFLLELLLYSIIIYVAAVPMMVRNKISQKLIILRFFDMIGWVIPPTFPIYFNLCYSFSLYRLRKQSIFGTQPLKTITSGKIKVVCFDKTGTLTQNKMNLFIVVRFDTSQTLKAADWPTKDESDILMKLFASCHTVRRINKEFVGDQLDLRMFQFSEFEYQSVQHLGVKLVLNRNSTRLEVLKINQFESKFQGMSVLVKDVQANTHYVFVKGAPEKVRDLSVNKYPEFDDTVSKLSLAGLRSLAFGYKQVNNPSQIMSQSRQEFEKGITLIGLVGFENKLKPDTNATITALNKANIQTKIITGDNIYIGVETALRAGFIQQNSQVIVLQGQNQRANADVFIGQILELSNKMVKSNPIQLSRSEYMSQSLPIAIDNSFFCLNPPLPQTVKVFARISPQNKAKVVMRMKKAQQELLMNLGQIRRCFGRTAGKVGMVGDGANDILAIREADVGIGISETDSSFAANFAIGCVMDVEAILREGKSTLTIIMEIFRYYISISILKYTACMIMAVDKSNYSDNQFTYFNYVQTLEIVVFLCLSHPASKLSEWIPNDNFMSLQNHLVVIGQIIISTFGVLTVYVVLVANPLFQRNPNIEYSQWIFQCQTNTAVFLTTQLFYIFNSVWIYTSSPWKQKIYKNISLTVWLIIVAIVNSAFFWFTPSLSSFLGLVNIGFYSGIAFTLTVAFILLGCIWSEIVRCSNIYKQ